jgi:hypothetical protein
MDACRIGTPLLLIVGWLAACGAVPPADEPVASLCPGAEAVEHDHDTDAADEVSGAEGSSGDFAKVRCIEDLLRVTASSYGCEAFRGAPRTVLNEVWQVLADQRRYFEWGAAIRILNTTGTMADVPGLIDFIERGHSGDLPLFDPTDAQVDQVWVAFREAIFAIGLIAARVATASSDEAAAPAYDFLVDCADSRRWDRPTVSWRGSDGDRRPDGSVVVVDPMPSAVESVLSEMCVQALGFSVSPAVQARLDTRRTDLMASGVWIAATENSYLESLLIRSTVVKLGGVSAHQRWRHSTCQPVGFRCLVQTQPF